ncbi:Nucleotidyltransferase domain protein [Syntrophobacter sp. SbD1]|nr:Nucleotidyltransferase domain protein [Syntrophobacter sp. SbD1]
MIDEKILQEIVTRIVAATKPSQVILFASYGRNEADEDSDLDIMVIQPRETNRGEEMVLLRQLIGPIGTGVDVLVYSEAEYERRSRVAGTLLYWARKEGRTIYEAPH